MIAPTMHDLLQPSLSINAPTRPIYSARAGFWIAFFGGPLAVALYGGLNAHRLGRLKREWPLYAAFVAAFVAAGLLFFVAPDSLGIDPNWAGNQSRSFRLGSRGFGLLMWLAVFVMHRRFHRAATMLGEDPPSPWKPGIAFVLTGMLATFLLGMAGLKLIGAI